MVPFACLKKFSMALISVAGCRNISQTSALGVSVFRLPWHMILSSVRSSSSFLRGLRTLSEASARDWLSPRRPHEAIEALSACASHLGEWGNISIPAPATAAGTAQTPNIICQEPGMGWSKAPAATPAQEPTAKAAQRVPLEAPRSSASTVSTTYAALAGEETPSARPARKRSSSKVLRSAKKVPREMAVMPTAVHRRTSRLEVSLELHSKSVEPQRAPQTRELTTAPMSQAERGNMEPTRWASVSCSTAKEVTPPSKPDTKLKRDGNNTWEELAK
mmetsp:Transcript_29612/g.64047  ORF Transcript_29612/g.64047 Transcript_29612/m.64047 type:complete len:276 (-) Transcript_29612:321-1148(-)